MTGTTPLLFNELKENPASYTTGILPSQTIEELIAAGHVTANPAIAADQIQPSSLDLRIGPVAYRVRASFLSSRNARVIDKLEEFHLYKLDLAKPAVLERGCAYVVPLMEELNLPADISGKANPKSTTGRLDVFTRLITDFGSEFERVPEGYKGKLYTEIVPRTFSITVEQGARLNQLRLRRGNPPPSDIELERLHEQETLVYSEHESPLDAMISNKSLWLSVDLSGDGNSEIIGYKARHNTPLITLSRVNFYDPLEYWEPIVRTKSRTLVLDPNDFYILASKERVRIPHTFAAEMVPYDPSVGEFRIHYAGFFDPGFGYGADDIKGTHAVLEVRSHEVPFLLEDGQVVGRLVFERLLSAPAKIYGQGIGSSYQHQRLALGKQFRRG
ncbi:MAG TPA: 2'-deoxycytidine 5'-triphosphate deaminase [Bryobacteraceae bacterium]|nr:2'-deoxycytidine 5'-triphosphate deaminase [Bryobacteraceae bacterium]